MFWYVVLLWDFFFQLTESAEYTEECTECLTNFSVVYSVISVISVRNKSFGLHRNGAIHPHYILAGGKRLIIIES